MGYEDNSKYFCDKCEEMGTIITIYGELLCRNCWTEYLNTDYGKVEYIRYIAKHEYPVDMFDADFLGFAMVQWNENKSQFDISDEELEEYEIKLKQLGLL